MSLPFNELPIILSFFYITEDYNAPLEKAYAFASKHLLDLLVKDRDLIGHLKSVKHYFLLDQGDFIVQFMDLCGDELCQSVDMVETTRLESLLELALRTSAAKEDPYKDNVRVELLPYDLIYQVHTYYLSLICSRFSLVYVNFKLISIDFYAKVTRYKDFFWN